MQTVSMPTVKTPPAAPAAVALSAPKTAPTAPPPMMPRYGYPPYPYAPYAWPGYPYPVPPMGPAPAGGVQVSEPMKDTPKAEKPVEKPVEKPKTADEKAEDELVEIFRTFIRSNPKLKAVLTPEVVQQLKNVADNPTKMKELLISEVAKGQMGQQMKKFLGKGWLSRMAQKAMLWISPAPVDPLLSGLFKQLGIQ